MFFPERTHLIALLPYRNCTDKFMRAGQQDDQSCDLVNKTVFPTYVLNAVVSCDEDLLHRGKPVRMNLRKTTATKSNRAFSKAYTFLIVLQAGVFKDVEVSRPVIYVRRT